MALTLINFSAGTVIKSSEMNSNFSAVNTELFDITNDNVANNAAIVDTKLAQITTAGKVHGSSIVASTIEHAKGQFVWTIPGVLVGSYDFPFPYRASATLVPTDVFLEIDTAPVGADLIVDIKKNGTTFFSTKPEIGDGLLTGGSGAVFNITTITGADKITAHVDQVGSSTPGSDIVISLRVDQAVPQ